MLKLVEYLGLIIHMSIISVLVIHNRVDHSSILLCIGKSVQVEQASGCLVKVFSDVVRFMYLKTISVSTIVSYLELLLGLGNKDESRYVIWVIQYCSIDLEFTHQGYSKYARIAPAAHGVVRAVDVGE